MSNQSPRTAAHGADFETPARAIRAGKWREKRTALKPSSLLDNRQARARVLGMVKAWLVAGSLVIVEVLDEKHMPEKFVEVAD